MKNRQLAYRWFAFAALVASSWLVVAAGQDVSKSVGVVPRTGPLQGQTIYTGTYALFVGIGSYADSRIPGIPSAPNDAKTTREVLVRDFGFDSNPDHTVLLTNREATRERIEAELARLCDPKRVHKTDRVFVFFSCHGQSIKTLDGDNHGYLLPYGAQVNLEDVNDPTPYQTTCIKMDDMVGKLAECPANHRVVVLDACFSGLAGKGFTAPVTFDPGVVQEDLAERGLVVLTAGTANQETFGVTNADGLSLFTKAFVDALKECAIQGRTVFLEQIASDAASRTIAASQGKQRPESLPKSGAGSMLFFPAANGAPAKLTESEIAALVKQADDAYYGKNGVVKDLAKAASLYREAADNGNARAMYALGHMLLYGQGGLPQDNDLAVSWIRKASDLLEPRAMNYLGFMYEYGREAEEGSENLL